ncbi:hypothetical protein OHA25_00440 [Nonomuraea sp. NBC_00507]|uniref:hypothetical protein n=1 Tax=Nonomuraea sp. NBC_00507 TaxID=2976002 RepID=UPI002E19B4A8
MVLVTAAAPGSARQDPVSHGTNNVFGNPTPGVVLPENQATLQRQFDIEIVNVVGGAITHVGATGQRTRIGSVERPATRPMAAGDGFWASKYSRAVNGGGGHVLAASVYVLRLKAGPDQVYDPRFYDTWRPGDPQDWRTSLINIRPDRYHEADSGRWQADTIYTDIVGGTGIFGGASSPPVGSPFTYYDEAARRWRPVTASFAGDYTKPPPRKLRFTVYKPVTQHGSPSSIEFENWAAGDTVAGVEHPANGRVLLGYPGPEPVHIADVLQRVTGVGRFGGTEFAHAGQVDTNHPGALTLSTSPYAGFSHDENVRGGLQIVPANHVKWLSHRLGQNSFIGLPQWLIVGAAGVDKALLDRRVPYLVDGQLSVFPGWEAIAPIFGMYVRTAYDAADPDCGTRFTVSTDYGRTWRSSPELVGMRDPSNCANSSCVQNWTNIRLHLRYPAGP